jgi:hypothetical protein
VRVSVAVSPIRVEWRRSTICNTLPTEDSQALARKSTIRRGGYKVQFNQGATKYNPTKRLRSTTSEDANRVW